MELAVERFYDCTSDADSAERLLESIEKESRAQGVIVLVGSLLMVSLRLLRVGGSVSLGVYAIFSLIKVRHKREKITK